MPYADPARKMERQRERRLASSLAKLTARRYKHPRCAICDYPMPYGAPGVNYRAVTCSRACAIKRNNWMRVR